jgi:transcriptional regulator with XRE-family HTH domain
MTVHLGQNDLNNPAELVRLECRAFAARLRMARAVLGWSQNDLALRVGLTQRAIHKLEQGDTEPRRATVRGIEAVWRQEGIEFEDLPDGGFRISIRAPLLDDTLTPLERWQLLNGSAIAEPSRAYRT